MKKAVFTAAVLLAASAQALDSRNYIEVVGSSTVYPFATTVAEKFGKSSDFKTPKIESTGSGGGIKLFCKGLGVDTPDITNASRRIKVRELEQCRNKGVTDVIELLMGYDGIAFANSVESPQLSLSRRDIFLALAEKIPGGESGAEMVKNPNVLWSDVNPDLPATKIEVLGPPPTSGTRDAFVELAMEGGCKTFDWIKALKKTDKATYKSHCHRIREDGHYVEAGENDNLIVNKLEANPNAFGIFGFSFLDQNSDKVQGAIIDGFEPTFESIADGDYKVSRPLYMYIKKAHISIVPGIAEYLAEFTAERTWGDEGYLADKGMIPLGEELRATVAESIRNLETLESLD